MNANTSPNFSLLEVIRLSVVCLIFFTLVGCADIRLTEPYNAKIEEGLNSYHQSLASFVKKMELAEGKPEGRYGNAEVTKFYADSEGTLANLVVKAEADAPGANCATSKLASKAVDSFLRQTADRLSNIEAPGDVEAKELSAEISKLNDGTSALQDGSCTAVVLKALRLNHRPLESLHRDNVYLVHPASTYGLNIMEDGIRIALINENAKKN